MTAVHFEDAAVKIMRPWVLMRLSSHLISTHKHSHTNSMTHLIATAAGACCAGCSCQRFLSNAKARLGVQYSLAPMCHVF